MSTSKLLLFAALPSLLSAQTTVSLSTSPNPSIFGAPVALTAVITPAMGTGKVTFYDGVTVLGTKRLVSGIASISTIALPAGSRKLRAYYSGSGANAAATSNILTQTVMAVAGGSLAIQSPLTLLAAPSNAALGDFNGDGKVDFAYPVSANIPPWWQVDLGASAAIGSIAIWNRTDCCGSRLSDYWVFVSDTPFHPLDTPDTLQNRAGTFRSHQTAAPNPSATIAVTAQGRYIRVQLSNPDNFLSLAEVQVFGTGTQAGTNLALGKLATQSNTFPGAGTGAASAVDGNTDGNFFHGSVSTTFIGVISAVTVVLGNGDGTFQIPAGFLLGLAEASSVAVGDFNGDGSPDLAVSGSATSILLGNGDGTFRPAVNYPASGSTLAIGDFNGDGKADIVVDGACHFCVGGEAYILFGNGDGSFGSTVSYSKPFVPPFVVADFNGDGNPDLASTGFFGDGYSYSALLGKGDGTHQSPVNGALGGGVTSSFLIAGDFNGDGKTDLAIGGSTPNSGNPIATTWILLGNGDGTFQPPVSYPGTAVTSGDFNGDGITDLVVADSSGNTSGILLGNGDGTFHQGLAIAAGAPLAVADFNGDGRADLLTANFSNGTVTVLLGAASGSISVTASGGTPQATPAGTPFAAPLQVTVLNNGVPVAGATVTFTVPTVGPSAALSSPTAVTNSSGVAVVTATANPVAGTYVVTASYNGMTASFALTNTAYASIAATEGTPQSTLVGALFPADLQATVKNALGNPVSGVVVTFSAPTVGATARLSSTTAITGTNGIASVAATANGIAGSYVVTAAVGAFSAQFSLTNTERPLAGIAALGSGVQFTVAGAAFGDPLQVLAHDIFFFPVSGVPITFSTPSVGPSATLSSTTVVTGANGIASVTATANNIAGTYLVTASAGSLSTSFSLTNRPIGTDLALGKTATQSSTLPGAPTAVAALAVDGNVDGDFTHGSVTATNLDANPWWQVDLGASAAVSSIVIWNRVDCCNSRLSDYWVFVSDTPFLATDTPATLQNRPGTFASHQTKAPDLVLYNSSVTLVVSSFSVIAAGTQGRYVRVQLSSANYLSLAEVQVFGTGGAPPPTNLAQGKPSTQSSTLPGVPTAAAASAVDGNTDGSFFNGSVTATNLDTNAWWQVDLGGSASISSIVIWNRTDCCTSRLSDYWVFVSDTPFLATDTPATLQNRAGTFASHQTTAPNPSTTIAAAAQGRYVRVQLSGADYLSLAEVQVFGSFGQGLPPVSNVSMGKPASQSSTLPGVPTTVAASAVDGNTDGSFYGGSVTATNLDANPWWQVDLGASKSISSVAIFNRTDCCGDRLSDYWVFVSDTPFLATDTPATLQSRAGTFASHQTTAPNPSTTITMTAQGRYVRVQLSSANYLSLAEVQVFGQ